MYCNNKVKDGRVDCNVHQIGKNSIAANARDCWKCKLDGEPAYIDIPKAPLTGSTSGKLHGKTCHRSSVYHHIYTSTNVADVLNTTRCMTSVRTVSTWHLFFHSSCVHKLHGIIPGPAWEVGHCVKNRNATTVEFILDPKRHSHCVLHIH